jgi:hypothetical protein
MGDGDLRDKWGLPILLPALPPDSQETLGAGGDGSDNRARPEPLLISPCSSTKRGVGVTFN